MKKRIRHGIITAIATPFCSGGIDYTALSRLIERQVSASVSGIVVCGTTGEAPALTDRERDELISRCAEMIDGRAQMLVGTGSLSFTRAIEQSRRAQALGADALLVITPFYNKGTRSGIAKYYREIASATDRPIMIYNVPSRTGVDISHETLAEIYGEENISAIKEAGASIDKVVDYATDFPELDVFSGNDSMLLPMLSLGGCGCVSVLSNIMPKTYVRLYQLYNEGKHGEALELQRSLTKIMRLLFADVNPAPLKCALALEGLCEGRLRLPLDSVKSELQEKIKHELTTLKDKGVLI